MHNIIIAIDGYSSCGKSTTAKKVATRLGYTYIDTGAMYRAVTLYFINNRITLTNPKDVSKALNNISIEFRRDEEGESITYLNGLNVEKEIRKMYVANKVSEVSAIAEVRHSLVAQQRVMGAKKSVVMDGRDIGTVVFPNAHLKVFMTAEPVTRAERRQKELFDKDEIATLNEILENIKKRDFIDTTRKESPLRQADDAVLVDTSHMTLGEQIAAVCLLADQAIARIISRNA
jgi:cytidylate kinase